MICADGPCQCFGSASKSYSAFGGWAGSSPSSRSWQGQASQLACSHPPRRSHTGATILLVPASSQFRALQVRSCLTSAASISVVWQTFSSDVLSCLCQLHLKLRLFAEASSNATILLKSSWSPNTVIIFWTAPASCASLFKPSQLRRPCLAGLAARNASVAQGNTGDGVNTEKKGVDFGKVIESGLNGPLTEALASYYVVSRHI